MKYKIYINQNNWQRVGNIFNDENLIEALDELILNIQVNELMVIRLDEINNMEEVIFVYYGIEKQYYDFREKYQVEENIVKKLVR